MTPIRYPFLLMLCCWLGNLQTALAQCDIQLSTQVTPVLCAGGNTGALNITASNGTGSYNYLWSNGQTTEDLNNLVAGTYTCTVTDDLACTRRRQCRKNSRHPGNAVGYLSYVCSYGW